MNPRPRLLIATGNPGKLREITAVLGDLGWALIDLTDLPGTPPVEEDAATFMGNAEKKALHYAGSTGLPTLADDSGLEVDCLGGRPGVRSARFAGEHGDDAANNARLVALLHDIPLQQRRATFRCAVAVAAGGGIVARAEGAVSGLIQDPPLGDHGFGYDPHFLIPGLGLTMAQLDPRHKSRISHRGRALADLRPRLRAALE